MKKFMKSKMFLAIVSIALVSSVLLAGTYSWFVIQNENDAFEVGGTAIINAANMEIIATGKFDITFSTLLENIIIGSEHLIKEAIIEDVEIDGNNINNLYPSEGARFALATDGVQFDITNTRAVIAKLDFTALIEDLEALKGDSDNEIYIGVNFPEAIDADDDNGIAAVEALKDVYYVYIPAGDETITLDEYLTGITIDFGFYGANRDDNIDWTIANLVNEETLDITLNSDLNVVVTVVQATPAAVEDVFEGAITLDGTDIIIN